MSDSIKKNSIDKGKTKSNQKRAVASKNASGKSNSNKSTSKKNANRKISNKNKSKKDDSKIKSEEFLNFKDAWQVFRLVHYFVIAVTLSIGVLLMTKVYAMDVLPFKYFMIITVGLLLLPMISIIFRKRKTVISIMMVLCLLLSAVESVGYMMIMKADETIDKLTVDGDIKVTYMEVIVMADDTATKVEELSGYKVGFMTNNDRTYSNNAIIDVNQVVEKPLQEVELENDPLVLVQNLYDGNVNVIILDDVYASLIEEVEQYKDFRIRTKTIHKVEIEEKIDTSIKNPEVVVPEIEYTEGAFVMYVSGIDTYGSVKKKSRSDVNILLAVNPKTKKILLVNTPRDYYIPLSVSGGAYDKLTHAGNFGVQCSMDTLTMLYGIDIKYYLRMNFSGFMTIIDAVGGIDVYSEYNFKSNVMEGLSFKKGMNYGLTGEQALAFARERYAFAAGDNQRGKNQMAVITAIINKLASSELLYNYTDVMDAIAGSFQTSMSSEEIYDFVKMQIDEMTAWQIESYAVSGKGGYAVTYSMPNMSTDVTFPDMETVEIAKEKLIAILTEK